MKNEMCAIALLVAFVIGPLIPVKAQDNLISKDPRAAEVKSWVGKYEFADSGMNTSGTRSYSIVHQLEIATEDVYSIFAKYRSFEGGGTEPPKFEMLFLGKLQGNELLLNYDHCFDEQGIACKDYRQGNLMLKLVKTPTSKTKSTIRTYWYKLGQPMAGQPNRVYFTKVPKFEGE